MCQTLVRHPRAFKTLEPCLPPGDGQMVPFPSESCIFYRPSIGDICVMKLTEQGETGREKETILHITHYLSYTPQTTLLPLSAQTMPMRQAQSPFHVPQEP